MGIVTHHAYSLLSVMEETFKGEKIRLVKVRNPWAHHEWNGDYSDVDTKNWTEDKKNFSATKKKTRNFLDEIRGSLHLLRLRGNLQS
jgi:hypothetical protein